MSVVFVVGDAPLSSATKLRVLPPFRAVVSAVRSAAAAAFTTTTSVLGREPGPSVVVKGEGERRGAVRACRRNTRQSSATVRVTTTAAYVLLSRDPAAVPIASIGRLPSLVSSSPPLVPLPLVLPLLSRRRYCCPGSRLDIVRRLRDFPIPSPHRARPSVPSLPPYAEHNIYVCTLRSICHAPGIAATNDHTVAAVVFGAAASSAVSLVHCARLVRTRKRMRTYPSRENERKRLRKRSLRIIIAKVRRGAIGI